MLTNSIRSLSSWGGSAALLLGVVACGTEPSGHSLPTAPLLQALSARYRPFDRQDTLESFWAPDSLMQDTLFQFTRAHRSRVLLRVRFVPAAALAVAPFDTLTFRRSTCRPWGDNYPGYHWGFCADAQPRAVRAETRDGVPLSLAVAYSYRLNLVQVRHQPDSTRVYSRNYYSREYPFRVVAAAPVGDSVVYVRAFPVLASPPARDTLLTYYEMRGSERIRRQQRVPLTADQSDTTRQALLRLSFRVLR